MQNSVAFQRKTRLNGIFIALMLLVFCAQTAYSISLHTRLSRLEESFPQVSIQAGIAAPSENKVKYILKEYSGRIGIFKEDSEHPSEILGVYVFTLPERDRTALQIGIAVYGEENLRYLIEDFTA